MTRALLGDILLGTRAEAIVELREAQAARLDVFAL